MARAGPEMNTFVSPLCSQTSNISVIISAIMDSVEETALVMSCAIFSEL